MPDPIKQKETKLVRVDQPKDPPKELLAQTFSAPDSLFTNEPGSNSVTAPVQLPPTEQKPATQAANGEPPKPPIKETVVAAPAGGEEKPVTEKKEEPTVSSVLKPPTGTTQTVVEEKGKKKAAGTEQVPQRDYTGFTQQEAAVLKQMSNEAFTFTSELLKKSKTAEQQQNNQYYQHPQAYALSPEYQQTQMEITFHEQEGRAWQNALLLCDEGKPFRPPAGFDEQGNLVLGKEIQPTKLHEETIRSNMNLCQQAIRDKRNNSQRLAQTYKQTVDSSVAAIQRERSVRFDWVRDPKLLDYTIQADDGSVKSIKQIKSDLISIFPSFLQNNPATEVASDLVVSLMIARAELREARNGKQIAEIQREEVKRGEPTSEGRPMKQPEPVGGVSEFSLSGMPT